MLPLGATEISPPKAFLKGVATFEQEAFRRFSPKAPLCGSSEIASRKSWLQS